MSTTISQSVVVPMTSSPPNTSRIPERAELLQEASQYVFLCVFTPLVIWSLIANGLVLWVLLRRALKPPASNLLLVCLAVTDSLGGLADLLWVLSRNTSDPHLTSLYTEGCHWMVTLMFFFADCSSWTVVLIAVERFIAVWFPHALKTTFSNQRAGVAVGLTYACILALNAHLIFTVDVASTSLVWICPARAGHEVWLGRIWPYIDPTLVAFAPFLSVSVLNFLVVISLRKRQKKHAQNSSPSVRSVQMKSERHHHHHHTQRDKENRRANIIMFMISVCFMILVPPVVVLHAMTSVFNLSDPISRATYYLVEAVLSCLFTANRGANFIIYSVANRNFRKDLKCVCGKKNHISSGPRHV